MPVTACSRRYADHIASHDFILSLFQQIYLIPFRFRRRKNAQQMLNYGLYEQVINNALNSELAEIPETRKAVAPIDKAEASKVLAQYLADVVQKGLDNVLDNGGDLSAQIALTNQIVALIQNTTKEADFPDRTFSGRGEKDRQAAFGSR